MFPSEFCKISKNTFSYKTPLVAASDFMDDTIAKNNAANIFFVSCLC